MSKATATAFFQIDLASQNNKAPEWIELFPAGPRIEARDGREWISAPQTVIAAFRENEAPLPIDYEHAQDLKAVYGDLAPAAGWIVDLEERSGALWGKVEWLADAAKMIVDKAYRFISPAFNHDKSGKITRLLGAGLVNRPALKMTALSRSENHQQETSEMLKAIAKALGLADDANEAAILAAIAKRDEEKTSLCAVLKIDATSDNAAVTAAIAKLQDAGAVATARETTELASMRTELAAMKKKQTEDEVTALLDEATKEGKITPASRDSYRAVCMAEGGIDRFKAIAATLPVICKPTALDGKEADTASDKAADPVALAAKARKYQDEQAAAGRTISFAEAVLTVEAQTK